MTAAPHPNHTDTESERATTDASRRAWGDVLRALRAWNIIVLVGVSDVKARYQRSILGQGWITISHGVMIAAIGVAWAYIWNQPVKEFLPYLAVGHIFWVFMTGCLTEASTTYADHATYLKELNLPRSTYIFSNLVKHIIVLGHNAVILIPVFAIFGVPFSAQTWLVLPALLVSIAALLACSIIFAIGGLRFRDLPNLLASLVGVAFFLTPVIWKLDVLPPEIARYMDFNPFAVFLELLRAPILGTAAPTHYWWIASGLTALFAALAVRVFVRYRARITYWL